MSTYLNILVKVTACESDNFLRLETYTRRDKRRKRFFADRPGLQKWLKSDLAQKKPFYDRDCNSFLEIFRNQEKYIFRITWLNHTGIFDVEGSVQKFETPAALLEKAVCEGASFRYLVWPNEHRKASIILHCSPAKKLTTPRLRRAFSKAMRDCFDWRSDTVHLYDDGGPDFYFTTESGCPANGGLILHTCNICESPKITGVKYSIHT